MSGSEVCNQSGILGAKPIEKLFRESVECYSPREEAGSKSGRIPREEAVNFPHWKELGVLTDVKLSPPCRNHRHCACLRIAEAAV